VRADDRWFRPDPRTGLRLADGLLRLIDHVDVVPGGGKHGQGYLFGSREVADNDWYFDCHFHRDPVMPGSLGVEAVLQALQVYVMDSGLADGMGPVEFRIPLDTPYTWRYRGQILRGEGDMTFDVHVREVRRSESGELIVVGDGSVWKPGLRIYELTGIAVAVRPARSEPA
jgi:3-hydroxymyristoyl/3-hydroxydecanoyl-(acyl carrier protein) dehydratase